MNEKTKKKNWLTTDNRFVVFIDILGFKDYVYRNSHEKVYEMMLKISDSKEDTNDFIDISNGYFEKKLYTTSFSDSIIIFSKDNSIQSFELITSASILLFADAIINSIPMKGAIAHGLISVNKKKQIYFGQPLIDAFLLQEEVYYYGIVSHNSIDKYLLENNIEKNIKDNYIEIITPLKTGNIIHNNINWYNIFKNFNNFSSVNKERFLDIIEKHKTMTSGGTRKYIDNTINVFYQIYDKLSINS